MESNKEIVQYEDKSCIEVNVVILPSKTFSKVQLNKLSQLLYNPRQILEDYKPQHLYFTSNEEIKELPK